MPVKERGDRGVVQSVVLFLGVSVLSGALAAGLVIPFAGLLGFGTEKTSETFEKLPTELQQKPLPVRSRIVAADGKTHIAYLYDENRVYVTLGQVSSIMKKAIIAIEDSRFYEHGALDAKGTLRALARNKAADGVTQGGSSITQQLVKMTLIQQATSEAEQKAATAETYERKIKELRYAVALEKQFSKDEILERYLNIAYFGDGAYGVEAAARHYYRTTSGKLTLAQAAMLAGLVKNPVGYDPTNNQKRAKDRRDIVLRRMQELNLITEAQANAAIKTPVIDLNRLSPVPNGCANSRYPFYCEYVVAKLLENPALGKTPADRERNIKTGGLTITTSLDPRMQAAAEAVMRKRTKTTDTAVAALTMVQPGTGLVKAMVQSRLYGQDKARRRTVFNYNVERRSQGGQIAYPGGFGGFQIGSTAKAFVLAAAIQKGLGPDYRINAPPRVRINGPLRTCNDKWTDDHWDVRNSTKATGNLTMTEAARQSTNTYFAQLITRTGLCAPTQLAGKLGVYNGQDGKPVNQFPSFVLGADYVTPLMMANSYATFAARGKYCNPVVVTEIRNKANKPIPTPGANCVQVMQPAQADVVNHILQAVMQPGGTGNPASLESRPAAGKTGTTSNTTAVWFVGYTPDLAAAATVADADPPQNSVIGLRLNGDRMADAFGGLTAGPIWRDAMRAALEGVPPHNFVAPDPSKVKGVTTDIPRVGGMSPGEATQVLQRAGFEVAVATDRRPSEYPEGTVAFTDPGSSEGAPSGSLITLYISNGQPQQQPKPTTSPPTTKPTKPPAPPPCPPWRPNCHR
jgi:membrane peptidoglycan carboxypeptidase